MWIRYRQIVVLPAHIGPNANHVPFVGHDDAESELFEESADLREVLTLLRTYLDREHDIVGVLETERHQHVRDGGTRPVRHDHVDGFEFIQVVLTRFPALRVVTVAAPIEIARDSAA